MLIKEQALHLILGVAIDVPLLIVYIIGYSFSLDLDFFFLSFEINLILQDIILEPGATISGFYTIWCRTPA